MMRPLTKEQKLILSGFTGVLMCDFSDLHEDIERRLGYAVFTHQFGNEEFMGVIKSMYRDEFLELCK